MVVRNSSTFTNVLQIFLFTLPNTFMVTIPMAVLVGCCWGSAAWPPTAKSSAMRASGFGIGYFVRVSSIVAIGGTLVGLANSLYVAPRANQAILDLEQALETSQASYEIQPRVFYEDFRNFVLYVKEVRAGTGAANWRQVFMANVTDPNAARITTAASATVVNDTAQELLMRLRNGAQHETVPASPSSTTSPPSPPPIFPWHAEPAKRCASRPHGYRHLRHLHANAAQRLHRPDGKALPAGVEQSLLLSRGMYGSDAGRRAAGRGFAARRQELRLCLYHAPGVPLLLPLLHRDALARQDKIPAFFAVWSANLVFAAAGIFLLWQMASGGRMLSAIIS